MGRQRASRLYQELALRHAEKARQAHAVIEEDTRARRKCVAEAEAEVALEPAQSAVCDTKYVAR